MLCSKPNAKKGFMGKSLNKLTIENKSDFEVKYKAYIYEASLIIHKENAGNVEFMGVGVGGNNKKDYVKGESLEPEIGFIQPKGTVNITVDGSKKVKLKYYYLDLHKDYTEEQRNFTVNDEVWFEQPTPEKIKQIKEQNDSDEERIKQEEERIKQEEHIKQEEERIKQEEERIKQDKELIKQEEERIKQDKERIKQEEERIKQEEERMKNNAENLIALPCATTYKHTCTKGGNTTQCPHCKHFYCEWHFPVNGGLFGGGHVCY